MSAKQLKPFTIIPPHLYVRRSADAQLQAVVENMGRPGYVLVARQMGKTNLLLNARRELGANGDIFLYVDLSNSFPDLRQFFRNIIDIALDVYRDLFQRASVVIHRERDELSGMPPHKEHERELRALLNATNNKIILCLDEIDALTKSDYSDGVFSLIRSTYFASRINFPEFNRLTYILSGVAEPNEIIKNKDISPFNIGEKIYLDDFTYEEFLEFVSKASLQFSSDALKRIFYWTSGNPRICWDLCSALEDRLLAGATVSPEIVDLTVRRLYLAEFNLAPVDHIRKLVAEDRDLRNAVVNIHYEKYEAISDALRNQLYLSGIIKADFTSRTIVIKNRVIEESLSEEWIKHIESSKLSVRERAEKELERGHYSEALDLFIRYEESAGAKSEIGFLYHHMGECCIRLQRYEEAIYYLTQKPFKKAEFAALYFTENNWLGGAYFNLGRIEECIVCYENVVYSEFKDGEHPLYYFEAAVNLSTAYRKDFNIYREKIVQLNKLVVENESQVFESCSDQNIATMLICAAYQNLAEAAALVGDYPEALRLQAIAVDKGDIFIKPKIMLDSLGYLPSREHRKILEEIVALLQRESISVQIPSVDKPYLFTVSVFAELLLRVCTCQDDKLRRSVLVKLRTDHPNDKVAWAVLRLAGFSALQEKKQKLALEFFREAVALPRDRCNEDERRVLLHYILLVGGTEKSGPYEEEYFQNYALVKSDEYVESDCRLSYGIISKYLSGGRIVQARRLFDKVGERRQLLIGRPLTDAGLLALEHLEIWLLVREGQNALAQHKAEALKKAFSFNPQPTQLFPKEMLQGFIEDTDFILNELYVQIPIQNELRRHGRNDIVTVRYKDGTIRQGKFKKYESDIKSGLCSIE